MGIKGWIAIGGGIVLTVATILGIRKDNDERNEKIQGMIRDVDLKEPEKTEEEKPKTVEEIHAEVTEAILGMDIDGDDDMTTEEVDEVIRKGNEVLKKANAALNGTSEFCQKQQEEILENLKKIKEAEEISRNRYFEEEWPKKVKEAVEQKNFNKLETLFDEKYAGGPWHPSPASVFRDARNEGVIDDKLYAAAAKYFDRLWNYSGD